jgi:hypothetical protein
MRNRKNDNTKGRNRGTKANRKGTVKADEQSVLRKNLEDKNRSEFSPEDATS